MTTDRTATDLYPLWLRQGRDDLEEHVERTQRGYDMIPNKGTLYARSVKAILDLRIQLLKTWDAAPQTLEDAEAADRARLAAQPGGAT